MGSSNKKGKGEEDASGGIHPLIKVFALGEKVGDGICVSWDVLESVIEVL